MANSNDEESLKSAFYKYDKHHSFPHELWTELYKSKSSGSKAIFLDADALTSLADISTDTQDETLDFANVKDRRPTNWSELPNLLLEQIFSFLSIREKYYACLVCRSWNRAFYLPQVWSHFVVEDTTLTRSRFNYYSGWQYVLDHVRTQTCLSAVGGRIRHLTFQPMLNFFNLYTFMNMVSWCREHYVQQPRVEWAVGMNIRTLRFTFPCSMMTSSDGGGSNHQQHYRTTNTDESRIRVFGTGGKLLAALQRLIGNLTQLRHLELIDLMLEPKEAQYLLDDAVANCHLTLRTLHIVNTTRVVYPLLHVGLFLNLNVLVISPQNLSDDIIDLLGYTKLTHLTILQNKYTPRDVNIRPVSPKVWYTCRRNNTNLRVHLLVESYRDKPLIWQPGAPVSTVLYDSPHIGVETNSLMTAVDFYKATLHVYGHRNVPRLFRSKSFHERADSNLMLLARQCQHLTTLIVTERISTATVLLLVHSTRATLKNLYIRGNAVILKCDWPKSPEWSTEFYSWLRTACKSYRSVEVEVSSILQRKNWHFMTDKEFRSFQYDVYV